MIPRLQFPSSNAASEYCVQAVEAGLKRLHLSPLEKWFIPSTVLGVGHVLQFVLTAHLMEHGFEWSECGQMILDLPDEMLSELSKETEHITDRTTRVLALANSIIEHWSKDTQTAAP